MINPYQELKQFEGQEIKYKQFCDILNIESKTGKAKILQLKQIKQYVDLVQQNRKIFIKKVYTDVNELQIIESQGKFTTYIENFLISSLYSLKREQNINAVFLTNRDILEGTYMVNTNYFKGKNCPYLFIDTFTLKMNQNDMPNETYLFNKILDESDIFFSSSYRLLKRVIYDSLTSMEKRSLIQKNKSFRLYKNNIDENGRFISEYKDCDDKDISRVLNVQHKTIREFNELADTDENGKKKYFIKDIRNIHILFPRQKREFFQILNYNLCEEFKEEGFNAYSTAWKINLAEIDSFEYEIKRLNYKNLNNHVQDKLLTAQDLGLIERALKEQFITTFIKC